MKYFIPILLIFFIISTKGFSQKKDFDKVIINAIPFYYEYAFDDINPDFVRSHSVYSFVSIDTCYINKLYMKIFLRDSVFIGHKEIYGGIRVVIDFISKNQIKSFVSISVGYIFYCVESNSNEFYFQTLDKKKCFIKECIPFADYLEYNGVFDICK